MRDNPPTIISNRERTQLIADISNTVNRDSPSLSITQKADVSNTVKACHDHNRIDKTIDKLGRMNQFILSTMAPEKFGNIVGKRQHNILNLELSPANKGGHIGRNLVAIGLTHKQSTSINKRH